MLVREKFLLQQLQRNVFVYLFITTIFALVGENINHIFLLLYVNLNKILNTKTIKLLMILKKGIEDEFLVSDEKKGMYAVFAFHLQTCNIENQHCCEP